MNVAPNSPRPGVVGGLAIVPPAVQESAIYFEAAYPWIGVYGSGAFSPVVGGEVEFTPGYGSGLPLILGGSATAYNSGTTYGAGALVLSGGVVYTSLAAANTGNTPATSPTWWRGFNFRGNWLPNTAYAINDVVLALDGNGILQTWYTQTAFTSGPTFSSASWTVGLVAGQIYYIVSSASGVISISNTLGGGAITFMTLPFGSGGVTALFGTAGFGEGTGLVPTLTTGALFAQGVLWMPSGVITVPAAPASAYSYLAYNSTTGLYWTSNPAGTIAGDAVLGWVVTDATDIVAASVQDVPVAAAGSENPYQIPSTSSLAATLPPTPIGGIAEAGAGTVSWDPITFASGADPSQIDSAVIVLLYQDASGGAAAHLTAALTNTAVTGAPATLATDTDLTGIVFAGDWLLVGGEMMYVTADASSSSVAVERALGLTTAENHAIGDPIYVLLMATFTYVFPPLFFTTANAPGWGPTEQLPNANIALFNIVVFNAGGGESLEAPINYSQAVGGLIATGNPASTQFLPHDVPAVVSGQAQLNFGLYRSLSVGPLAAHTQISPINTTGLGPFLWVLTVIQDATGGRAMIPAGGITVALSTEQSPPNTQVSGLFFFDGAGNHLLLSSTGDQPIP